MAFFYSVFSCVHPATHSLFLPKKKRKKISIVIIFIKYSNPGPIVANQIEKFFYQKKKYLKMFQSLAI
jgi:hypothetical protein